jgi:RNA ligase
MKYQFPLIKDIDDILPAIKDSPEFIVAERDGYTVINYQVITPTTFPPVEIEEWTKLIRTPEDWVPDVLFSKNDALRRECRGVIFDPAGRILRRPLHKFFNANELVETQSNKIDLSAEHDILEKLDGSMIAPFFANGRLIWGTKMGDTEVAAPVNRFADEHQNYNVMAAMAIKLGYTPIFEWCSRQQRIVLDYKDDQLVLVAMRNMFSGEYAVYKELVKWGDEYDIPVVATNPKFENVNELITFVRNIVDQEGFVIRFADGHMVKVKSDWYVAIHKAKDKILWDRNIVDLILQNGIDDVYAHLPEDDQKRMDTFVSEFWKSVYNVEFKFIKDYVDAQSKSNGDRKDFALNYKDLYDQKMVAMMFRLWDELPHIDTIRPMIIDVIKKSLSRNSSYEELRDSWFPSLKFNA